MGLRSLGLLGHIPLLGFGFLWLFLFLFLMLFGVQAFQVNLANHLDGTFRDVLFLFGRLLLLGWFRLGLNGFHRLRFRSRLSGLFRFRLGLGFRFGFLGRSRFWGGLMADGGSTDNHFVFFFLLDCGSLGS